MVDKVHVAVDLDFHEIRLQPVGELGHSGREDDALFAAYRPFGSGVLQTIVVDLDDVTFIDSTGIGMLYRLVNWARSHGARVRVENPTPSVRRALDVASVAQVADVDGLAADAR